MSATEVCDVKMDIKYKINENDTVSNIIQNKKLKMLKDFSFEEVIFILYLKFLQIEKNMKKR